MQILSVTAEIFPLAKTGGLADVAGSLPKALQAHGIHTRSFVPGYPGVVRALSEASAITEFDNLFGERATLLAGRAQGLDLFVLDAPGFYNRQGPLYTDTHGREYADNWKRFAAFSLVGSQIARGLVTNWRPDVIHAHDWHAAMSLLYLKYAGDDSVPRVLTVHNLAFQGQFPAYYFPELGLPAEAYSIDGVEYYGDIGFLKGGLQAADAITVVSPTYAREVMSPAFGMGLEGVMNERHVDVVGIVNGIDLEVWDSILGSLHRASLFDARTAAPPTQPAGAAPALRAAEHVRTGLRQRQPIDMAEGHGPSRGNRGRDRQEWRHPDRPWTGRRGAGGRVHGSHATVSAERWGQHRL